MIGGRELGADWARGASDLPGDGRSEHRGELESWVGGSESTEARRRATSSLAQPPCPTSLEQRLGPTSSLDERPCSTHCPTPSRDERPLARRRRRNALARRRPSRSSLEPCARDRVVRGRSRRGGRCRGRWDRRRPRAPEHGVSRPRSSPHHITSRHIGPFGPWHVGPNADLLQCSHECREWSSVNARISSSGRSTCRIQ